MGTVLHLSADCAIGCSVAVSVPFSMGTVLHRGCDLDAHRTGCIVSVPFSMGTVLHPPAFNRCSSTEFVSVPFSMGTVLHPLQNLLILHHLYHVQEPFIRGSSFCVEQASICEICHHHTSPQ